MAIHARLMGLVSVLFFSQFAGVLLGEGSPAVAPPSPSKELAIRLLVLRDERFAKDYEVALIMPGEAKFQGLTVANAAKVSFFGPTIEEGKKRRSLETELFLWNEEYGWFLCEFGSGWGGLRSLFGVNSKGWWKLIDGEGELLNHERHSGRSLSKGVVWG